MNNSGYLHPNWDTPEGEFLCVSKSGCGGRTGQLRSRLNFSKGKISIGYLVCVSLCKKFYRTLWTELPEKALRTYHRGIHCAQNFSSCALVPIKKHQRMWRHIDNV